MSSSQAIAYQDELSRARETAAARRRALAEAPEMSTDDILAGFKRELRSVSVPGFGKIYCYRPGIVEAVELQEKADKDGTARSMVHTIIALARNSDGSLKFKPEHEEALLQAPSDVITQLVNALVESFRFTVVSAEKK